MSSTLSITFLQNSLTECFEAKMASVIPGDHAKALDLLQNDFQFRVKPIEF